MGAAVVAAIAAMAFLGVSSAVAMPTVLCSANELPCAAAHVVTHVHFVDGAAKLLAGTSGTVSCTTTLFLGDALALGAPLVIHGNFTYSGCVRNGGPETCEVTETSTSSLLNVLMTAANLGEVTGEGEVHVHCGTFIDCFYKGEGLKGHALGANLPTTAGDVALSEQEVKKVKGLFCPATAKLDIKAESLTDVYVSE